MVRFRVVIMSHPSGLATVSISVVLAVYTLLPQMKLLQTAVSMVLCTVWQTVTIIVSWPITTIVSDVIVVPSIMMLSRARVSVVVHWLIVRLRVVILSHPSGLATVSISVVLAVYTLLPQVKLLQTAVSMVLCTVWQTVTIIVSLPITTIVSEVIVVPPMMMLSLARVSVVEHWFMVRLRVVILSHPSGLATVSISVVLAV